MTIPSELSRTRDHFPSLQETGSDGRSFVFFDGPAGTQVPREVIEAVTKHYQRSNALSGGDFIVSRRCSEIVDGARSALADFVNAPSPETIVFGPNMTTLTYGMSRALGRTMGQGDEIIVTRLDHDANVAPWKALAERGVTIHELRFDPTECRLDLDQLDSLLNERTRIVAVGYASNLVGTINPVRRITEMAHEAGARVFVDAVHFAPHHPIDVTAIGCDFLVCSVYKFFGPHVGALYASRDALDSVTPYQVEPADKTVPVGFETGMLNFEGLAGTIAAIDYLASVVPEDSVELPDGWANFQGRRKRLKASMLAIAEYERDLCRALIEVIHAIPGATIYGITRTEALNERCPTVSFRIEGRSPAEICRRLGEHDIFAWHGNNYALGITTDLGIEEIGGVVRVGIAHYNNMDDVRRFDEVMQRLVREH